MELTRRQFAITLTGLAGAAGIRCGGALLAQEPDPCDLPAPIRRLEPMTAGAVPIGDPERRGRIAKAQRLMGEHGIGAVVIEPGSTMSYYTGVGWSTSERTFVLVLPARGEPAWICPAFEEARARELIRFGERRAHLAGGREPVPLLAGLLRDRGVATGRIGLEEQVRFFVVDGLTDGGCRGGAGERHAGDGRVPACSSPPPSWR